MPWSADQPARARRAGRLDARIYHPGSTVGVALAFGVLEIAIGQMPTFQLTGITLVAVGIAGFTFTTTANVMMLLSVVPAMRAG